MWILNHSLFSNLNDIKSDCSFTANPLEIIESHHFRHTNVGNGQRPRESLCKNKKRLSLNRKKARHVLSTKNLSNHSINKGKS